MTLDSICKVGFGVEIGTLNPNLPENSFAKAFDAANVIVTLRFIDPLWKIKQFLNIGSEAILDQSIKKIDDFTYSVIRKRKAELETNDKVSSYYFFLIIIIACFAKLLDSQNYLFLES